MPGSSNVDTRVVEAKFDSKDFEKGVDKTIKKLDELKKAMNVKETGESIADLGKQATKTMDQASKSIDNLSNRLTTFSGMLKQKLLGGIADQVVGEIFKIQHAFSGFVRSISTDQISQGMSKYTEMLNSVRVMVNSGISENKAYTAMEELANYSDQTSYSLSQMADSMSKFIAAGSGLEKAKKMVQGVGNAAASMGVSITDANRAYYNLQQAFTTGSMKYTDWRSFELLNMAGQEFKDTILEAAAEAEVLTKTLDKAGNAVYKIAKGKGRGKQVTKSNFSETLQYEWFNKDVMSRVFGEKYYLDAKEYEKYKEKLEDMGITGEAAVEKLNEQFGAFQVKAYESAKEARSFVDVINTIKDVVATGWAKSFELIFGRLEEAKEFFTWLSESNLADVIYSFSEFRNTVLGTWAQESIGGNSGRSKLVEGLKSIDEIIGSLTESISKFAPDAKKLGWRLRELTFAFADNMDKLRSWLKEVNEETGKSRIDTFAQIVANVGTVFSVAGKLIGIAGETFTKVLNRLAPILDAVGSALERTTEPLTEVKDSEVFDKITQGIDNLLKVIQPVLDVLPTVIGWFGELGAFFVSMGIDTIVSNITFMSDALGLLLEVFGIDSAQKLADGKGVLGSISDEIEAMKAVCTEAVGAVDEFLKTLISDLRTLFGLGEKEGGEGASQGGLFSGLTNFFETNEFVQSVKDWVNQAIEDIKAFVLDIPNRISQFAISVGDIIHGLFFEKKHMETAEGGIDYEVETPLKQWLDSTVTTVKQFIGDIPKKIKSAGSLIGQIWNSLFFDEKEVDLEKGGKKLKGAATKKVLKPWVSAVISFVQDFIKKIPEYINTGISAAGGFLRSVIGAIFGKKDGKPITGEDVANELAAPFKDINIQTILENIRSIGKNILNQVASIFTGTENADVNAEWWSNILANALKWLKEKAENIWPSVKQAATDIFNEVTSWFTNTKDLDENKEKVGEAVAAGITAIETKAKGAWETVKTFFETLPSTIAGFFKDGEGEEAGPIESAISSFATTVGGFILDIPGTIASFFESAIEEITGLWDDLYQSLIGENKESHGKQPKDLEELLSGGRDDSTEEVLETEKSKWDEFVEKFGSLIQTAFANIPTMIAQGLEIAVAGVENAIAAIGEWFQAHSFVEALADDSPISGVGKEAAGIIAKSGEEAAEEAEDAVEGKNSPLVQSLINIGTAIARIITQTIPSAINDGWTFVSTNWESWKDSFLGIFKGIQESEDLGGLQETVYGIGERIRGFIEELPTYISQGWEAVKAFVEGLFGSGTDDSVDAVTRAAEKPTKSIEEKITEFFHNLGEKIKNLAIDLGPKILDGLNTFVEWIGTGLQDITKFLEKRDKNDDIVTSLTKSLTNDGEQELSPLMQSIINLGKRIWELLTEIIPPFIEAAAGEISTFLGTAFGGLFDSILPKEAADGVEKTKDAATELAETKIDAKGAESGLSNLQVVLNEITTFFAGISVAEVGKIALIVAAIIVVANTVKSIFETMNVVGQTADYMKWSAIKTAIIGMLGIIAYIFSLPHQSEDVYNKSISMFDKLLHLVDKLAQIFLVFKGINLAKSIFGSKGGDGTKTNWLVGSLQSMLGGIGESIGAVAGFELFTEGVGDVLKDSSNTFSVISANFDTIAAFLNSAYEKLVPLADQIDTVDKVAGKVLSTMTTLSRMGLLKGKMDSSTAALSSISVGIESFKTAVSGKDIRAEEMVDAIDKLIMMQNKMVEFAAFSKTSDFEDFKFALASLGGALSLFHVDSFANVVTDSTGIERAIEVLGAIFGDEKLQGIADMLSKTDFPDAHTTFGQMESLTIFAGSLMTLASASEGLESDAGEKIGNLFDVLNDINVPPDLDNAKLVANMSAIGLGLEAFSEGTKNITSEMVTNARDALGMLAELAKELKGTGQSTFEKILIGDSSITNFGANIKTLGENLGSFFTSIGTRETGNGNREAVTQNMKNIEAASYIIRSVADAASKINGAIITAKVDKLAEMSEHFKGIGEVVISFVKAALGITEGADDVSFLLTDDQHIHVKRVLEYASTVFDWFTQVGNMTDHAKNMSAIVKEFSDAMFESKDFDGFIETFKKMLYSFGNIWVQIRSGGIAATKGSVTADELDRTFELMGHLFEALSTVSNSVFSVEKLSYDVYNGVYTAQAVTSSWAEIVEIMQYFVDHNDVIKTFINDAASYNTAGIQNATTFFEGMNHLAQTLFLFGEDEQSMYNGLYALENFDFDRIAELIGKIINVMKTALGGSVNRTRITDLGSNFASVLVEGIQAALNSEDAAMHPKIVPVLDMESLGGIKQQLSDAFSNGSWDAPIMQIQTQLAGLSESLKPIDYTSNLTTINSSVGALSGDIQSVATAISGMRITIDGRAIAGVIDQYLGDNRFYYNRGNAGTGKP